MSNKYIFLLISCSFIFSLAAVAQNKSLIEQKELRALVAEFGFKVDDFDDLEKGCASMDPEDYVMKGFQGTIKKSIERADYSVPKGASVAFCEGNIEGVYFKSGQKVRILAYDCDGTFEMVNKPIDAKAGNPSYACRLWKQRKINGVTLPANTYIVFNKRGEVCLYNKEQGQTINGIVYKVDVSYKISDSSIKVTMDSSCY